MSMPPPPSKLADLLGFSSCVRRFGRGVPSANIGSLTFGRPCRDALEWGADRVIADRLEGGHGRGERGPRFARGRIQFVGVDARTGKAVPVPDSLPSSATSNPLPQQPLLASYLSTVTGLPERWSSKHAATPES